MSDLVLCTTIFCGSTVLNMLIFWVAVAKIARDVKAKVSIDKKIDVDVDTNDA